MYWKPHTMVGVVGTERSSEPDREDNGGTARNVSDTANASAVSPIQCAIAIQRGPKGKLKVQGKKRELNKSPKFLLKNAPINKTGRQTEKARGHVNQTASGNDQPNELKQKIY